MKRQAGKEEEAKGKERFKRRRQDEGKQSDNDLPQSSVSSAPGLEGGISGGHISAGSSYELEVDEFDADAIPSDTFAAIISLAGESINPTKVVLRHQLYSVVKDRTAVDREINRLRKANKIRYFALPTGGRDCQAIMLTEDFVDAVTTSIYAEKNARAGKIGMVFLQCLPKLTSSYIAKSKLFEILQATEDASITKEDAESVTSLLMRLGVLIRRRAGEYLFSIPRASGLIVALHDARKEIKRIIQKRMYKEILLKELEKKRLKKSKMDIEYHIRDMHGLSLLEFVQTSVGVLVRIPPEDFREGKF